VGVGQLGETELRGGPEHDLLGQPERWTISSAQVETSSTAKSGSETASRLLALSAAKPSARWVLGAVDGQRGAASAPLPSGSTSQRR